MTERLGWHPAMPGNRSSSSGCPPTLLRDGVTEADERYPNAGEKGVTQADPEDPPRRRATTVKGQGTWDHDRPPIAGVGGRESGELRLAVCPHRERQTLPPFGEARTTATTPV